MAIQSKSVSQLKSEVLKTSSRPYELIEYNSDKIITKEINPELVASDVNSLYEKNSSGTIIIDKNKDLTKRKMLISLTATKISNVKFNEIIDTEFQDFVESVDLSQNFLSSQINGMQIKAASDAADKKVLEAKILGLLNQNEALQAFSALSKVNINTAPDTISYGTDLNADNSGVGNMLLSKNKKARAVITNTSFKVTLGNYDHTGKLLDGEEVVTFQPVFAGNIGTKNLTDDEASNYLINNPDLEPYFRSPTEAAKTIRDRINNVNYLSVPIPNELLDDTMRVPEYSYPTIDQKKAALTEYSNLRALTLVGLGAQSFYDFRDGKVQRLEQAGEDLDPTWSDKNIPAQIDKIKLRINGFKWWKQNDPDTDKYDYWLEAYESISSKITDLNALAPGWWNIDNIYPGKLISNNIQAYTPNYIRVQNQSQILRKQLVVNIMNFQNISSTYTIPYNTNIAIPIDSLISFADRDVLRMTNLLAFSPTGNIIESAKAHWRYVVEQKPNELDTRFYLSDAQAQSYLNNYGDLQAVYGNDLVQAKRHWNIAGVNEGRTFAAGNSMLHIWRSDVDKKGYIEIVKGQPWHVRYSSEYLDLSKSSRIFLDDNGILYLYNKAKIVWQSFNE